MQAGDQAWSLLNVCINVLILVKLFGLSLLVYFLSIAEQSYYIPENHFTKFGAFFE